MSASRNADWLDRKLFPYTQKRLELDGHELAYVDEGKGPPLLMLHGNPTWSFLYRDVIAGLRERFRCIAPDLPGFGFSTPAAGFGFRPSEHSQVIERFIEALDLRDITLMVHDWGGPIGLGAAGRNPERFSAVILANTFAWPVNGDFHVELASRLMGGPIGKLLITHANAFVNLLVPAGIRRGGPPSPVMAAYRGPFAARADRYPTYVFPREILKSRAFLAEVERGLTLLRDLPALILWGDRDIAFRDKERARFEELFPKHRTVALEGAGHPRGRRAGYGRLEIGKPPTGVKLIGEQAGLDAGPSCMMPSASSGVASNMPIPFSAVGRRPLYARAQVPTCVPRCQSRSESAPLGWSRKSPEAGVPARLPLGRGEGSLSTDGVALPLSRQR